MDLDRAAGFISMIDDSLLDYCVLRCSPLQTLGLVSQFEAMEFSHYTPIGVQKRRVKGEMISNQFAILPGFIFLSPDDLKSAIEAYQQGKCASFSPMLSNGRLASVDEAEISALKWYENKHSHKKMKFFDAGKILVVSEGPFEGRKVQAIGVENSLQLVEDMESEWIMKLAPYLLKEIVLN